jgi:hypothetical protein
MLAAVPTDANLPLNQSSSDYSGVTEGEAYRVEVDRCRPYALTRRDMLRLTRSPRLVQRLVWSLRNDRPEVRWLVAHREGRPGCELLVTTNSFEVAMRRIAAGEQPPLLPSELRRLRQPPPTVAPRLDGLPQ